MPVLNRRALMLAGLLACSAHAAIEVYDFRTPEEEARFRALTGELRCPKCQNQNLAGSDAHIAHDLKQRTFQLIREGKSDNEIRNYMIDRYGEFITYKPPCVRPLGCCGSVLSCCWWERWGCWRRCVAVPRRPRRH
jgi:cytochrome c-type biogenesis protein CcmH